MNMEWSTCPFCDLSLPSSQLQWHANAHFDDREDLPQQFHLTSTPSPQSLQSEQAASDSQFGETSGDCNHWDVGETSRDNGEFTMDDKMSSLIGLQAWSKFYKVEGGLMALLRNCLESEPENSKAILSGYVDHFQSLEFEDAGWGCGWRNIQMLCSHLLVQRPEAREALFGGSGFVPDIPSLQRWLEIAWEKGFDPDGSAQFDNAIYGSQKWIGTTECATLLRSFALRARVVDFGPKESESCYISVPGSSVDDALDKKSKAYQVLTDFVWNYFSDKSSIQFDHQRVLISEKTPLYFQHDGHSRTIVGIQVEHQLNGILEYNLLILDPAHSTVALERSLKEKVGWQKLMKRGMHTLEEPQYQLCYVDPGIASGEEMEKLKTIDSVFLEF
ncbi:hypothetical protein TanjilG_00478 [Lupinus angustifolius]|uniref:UFSP1/2/DUB catalytic domain-containing protein n=1 Tax=Lupinus angustifolius TaxID=3871 RepID=A0A4P1QX86_LUPAN|nr:PREDICTED: zinc finger with UFM1-specific peptidase domain protein-like [Lupinus angustifolius]XP_019415986.1 PREDICTED: zinc finger with UFM1-specific peptidase domain protein-like [Lupinus angustifolius]XP_019415987.1 PREDICTED: zinc finger with UFM1-specific peptidase domain protein-like [Lupinus angustifolius]XP_019415988.1 PREDICTED: zinc finger with UFM1-specific peptidase domain protein-like [Lupinus angustifolius]XP_019415989.1 PREDICTED: zinc finger with UFM1-specific peptidase doma